MHMRNWNFFPWKPFILFVVLSVIYIKINKDIDLFSTNFNTGKCYIPPLKDSQDVYNQIRTVKLPCKNLVIMGGKGGNKKRDGVKPVCRDSGFHMEPNNCLVLSFGIGTDWSFDEEMENYGCIVHSFDPTIGLEDFDKKPRLHFHNLGISNYQGIKKISKKDCKVDRFENILKNLDLIDKKIDYLKIDVEGSEREFFADVFPRGAHLLKNVRQIGMEIHIGNPARNVSGKIRGPDEHFKAVWKYLLNLECIGFKIVTSSMNARESSHFMYKGREEAKGYEVLLAREL